jgi:NTP pyrophosphatase (non-canonical NTP hydrolase)
MEKLSYRDTEYFYTCGVCGQEFSVPWFGDLDYPPEMIEVIEHEEKHRENGEEPSWELVLRENEMAKRISDTLIRMVYEEINRGIEKWGATDVSPDILLNAAVEELGEVAHAINHKEGAERVRQEVAECMGVLSRLFDMVK